MSVTCIEVLSSDDDVEIISGTCTNTNGPNFVNDTKKLGKNALQKLSRNSNIELTINLENVSYEPKINTPSSVKPVNSKFNSSSLKCQPSSKNGFFTPNTESHLQDTNKVSTPLVHGTRSPSPDVVIIDDDPLPDEKQLIQKNETFPESPLKSFFNSEHLGKYSSLSNAISSVSTQNSLPKSQLSESSDKTKKLSEINQVHSSRQTENCTSPTPSQRQQLSQPSKEVLSTAQLKKIQTCLSNDVVYVIDDGSDEEVENVKSEESSTVTNTINNKLISPSISHTEKVVQAMRDRIGSILHSSKECPTSKGDDLESNINTKSSEDKKIIKKSVNKKRLCPDKEVSLQDTSGSSKSNGRLTRSSLSLKSKQSPSKSMDREKNSCSSLDIQNQPMNKYSIENMFSGLVDICSKIFTDDKLESKLWNTFRQASDSVLRSAEFISALKIALSTAENSKIETVEEKLLVQREVKEVIRIMKRHPVVVDSKVRKLTRILNLIRGRIRKLEETEVTSDEDGEENAYVLLDRYRSRAAKIFEKICELQGEPSHAGRQVRQRFTFAGNSGYPKIEQALQKFYQKTRMFPDFMDVKTLVEMTAKKENMDIPPFKIHTIAQSIFTEFGNRLQRMRCFDEYSIMNEYLDDGKAKDPALCNTELQRALSQLNSSKKIKEAEQKIFEEFACKAEQKAKEEPKSGESDEGSTTEEDTHKNNLEGIHFSDTDEELINTEVKEKRGRSPSLEEDENSSKLLKTDDITHKIPKVVIPRIEISHLPSASKS